MIEMCSCGWPLLRIPLCGSRVFCSRSGHVRCGQYGTDPWHDGLQCERAQTRRDWGIMYGCGLEQDLEPRRRVKRMRELLVQYKAARGQSEG